MQKQEQNQIEVKKSTPEITFNTVSEPTTAFISMALRNSFGKKVINDLFVLLLSQEDLTEEKKCEIFVEYITKIVIYLRSYDNEQIRINNATELADLKRKRQHARIVHGQTFINLIKHLYSCDIICMSYIKKYIEIQENEGDANIEIDNPNYFYFKTEILPEIEKIHTEYQKTINIAVDAFLVNGAPTEKSGIHDLISKNL